MPPPSCAAFLPLPWHCCLRFAAPEWQIPRRRSGTRRRLYEAAVRRRPTPVAELRRRSYAASHSPASARRASPRRRSGARTSPTASLRSSPYSAAQRLLRSQRLFCRAPERAFPSRYLSEALLPESGSELVSLYGPGLKGVLPREAARLRGPPGRFAAPDRRLCPEVRLDSGPPWSAARWH